MAEMVQGQLYRVGLTGRAESDSTTVEFITVGLSAADVMNRCTYLYDVSDFASYRIDFVEKVAGRVHVVKTKLQRAAPSEPDAVISRNEGSSDVWQKVKQTLDSKKFLVHATTTCFAKDEKHAIKKLIERLSGGSERVMHSAEEVAQPSGFAVAKDTSVFPQASFVRG